MAETTPARVPTTTKEGWSMETAIDHLLAVVNEKHAHILTLVAGNDKRYEERFAASQKALELGLAGQKSEITTALIAADRAVTKAELATEKRFESVNEFRGTLDQQQRTLIPRSEVAAIIEGVNEKIGQLTKQVDILQTDLRAKAAEQKGVGQGWGYAAGALGFVIGLLGIIGWITARMP